MLMAYASVALLGRRWFRSGVVDCYRFIRPDNMYDRRKNHECGEAPVGPAWFNFNPRFYIVALIFIIFDVEIAFIYPVARAFGLG